VSTDVAVPVCSICHGRLIDIRYEVPGWRPADRRNKWGVLIRATWRPKHESRALLCERCDLHGADYSGER